jgi:hypothetical protein
VIVLWIILGAAIWLLLFTAVFHVTTAVVMRRRSGAVGDKAVTGAADSLTGEPVRRRTVQVLPPADWGFQQWLD